MTIRGRTPISRIRGTSPNWLVCLALPLGAAAQDSRTVIEPVEPPTCQVLEAKPPRGERGTRDGDQARIQAAIDRCKGAGAVRLRASADTGTFHSGPLELRSGMALVVERGVTLVASDRPADY